MKILGTLGKDVPFPDGVKPQDLHSEPASFLCRYQLKPDFLRLTLQDQLQPNQQKIKKQDLRFAPANSKFMQDFFCIQY
ncbi:MAG: hypothetical protein LBJ18_03550 [Rickettsiales bacterium]|nr:hypothetical protein [Rickettsiales bacterium]